MTHGRTDVRRVNAAGILAKVAAAEIADRIIAASRVDSAARTFYLTAVASRVLAMPWDARREARRRNASAASRLGRPAFPRAA
jgi:hypothetical protein